MQTSDRISPTTAPHHATRKHLRLRQRNYPFYFVAGALLLYIVFFLIPALMGFYYAFTDWNSYSTDVNFVGLDNFRVIFSSHENYLSYVQNTLAFALVTIILKTVLGLLLALLLNGGLTKFTQLHRTVTAKTRGLRWVANSRSQVGSPPAPSLVRLPRCNCKPRLATASRSFRSKNYSRWLLSSA